MWLRQANSREDGIVKKQTYHQWSAWRLPPTGPRSWKNGAHASDLDRAPRLDRNPV